MHHIYKGAEIGRDTKTLCGKPLESLPRKDGSVPYRSRKHADCPDCKDKARAIAAMRGEKA